MKETVKLKIEVSIPPGDSFAQAKRYVVYCILELFMGFDVVFAENSSRDGYWVLKSEGKPALKIKNRFFRGNQWSKDLHQPIGSTFLIDHPKIPLPTLDRELIYQPQQFENVDPFGICFFFLSRIEELLSTSLDEHGRFRPEDSWAFREKQLRFPTVDFICEQFRSFIERAWPGVVPKRPNYTFRLSHDVDVPYRWAAQKWQRTVLSLGSAIIKRRSLAEVRDMGHVILGNRPDPIDCHPFMLDEAERLGIKATYYFIAGGNHKYDATYNINSRYLESLFQRLKSAGHEIGLHGSYQSFNNANLIASERARLEKVTLAPIQKSRQHFLRFSIQESWSALEAAGVREDSTLAHASEPGFRAGTSQQFPVFDLIKNRTLNLFEMPLVFMEHSALAYKKMTPDQFMESFNEIKNMVKKFRGNLTLLWHSHNLYSEVDRRLYVESLKAGLSD